MTTARRQHTSEESFDEFLAEQELLALCEEDALAEIAADMKGEIP